MFARQRCSLWMAAWAAVMAVGGATQWATAGPIAAGSVPGGPPVIGSPAPGTPVSAANLITNQYRSAGLDGSFFTDLSGTALATIGGTTAFVPAVNTSSGYVLDYSGFVGFQIVDPDSGAGATTGHLSVEFLSGSGTGGLLYAMTAEGGIIGTATTGDAIGPNGGRTISLDLPGIAMFAVWAIFDSNNLNDSRHFWGLATIDIGRGPPDDGNVAKTPEPASAAIAGMGVVIAAGAAWKRRRPVCR